MPSPLYPTEILRALEQRMYKDPELDEYKLMYKAGVAAFEHMKMAWPDAQKIAVLIGKGNNGGDGVVLSGLAQLDGLDVTVYYLYPPDECSKTQQQALLDMSQPLSKIERFDPKKAIAADLVVDAVLGIGIKGKVQSPALEAIEWMNRQPAPVFAIDVPSGLNANTGQVANVATYAEKTVTFLGLKPGLYMSDGRDHAGEILFESLGCPEEDPPIHLADKMADPRLARRHNSHKGDYGRVLVVGGNHNMGGAALLAGQAALESGAGLVKLCTHASWHTAIVAREPGLMPYSPDSLEALLHEASVVAVGPGLGLDEWGERIFERVMKSDKPMVVDASALQLLAKAPRKHDAWILTPHPGEAAALLGCTTEEVQADRFKAAGDLVERYGGTVVLKGSGTLTSSEMENHICPYGNPFMAQAGMGDVLTGVVAAMLAEGAKPFEAASYAVYRHAKAGDACLKEEGRVLASRLIEYL